VQDRKISDTRLISLSYTFCRCLIFFLTFISSCVLFDSYVLLADDPVNNVSYFPFMSIKKVIPYVCVLREGYYVILWLIVKICVFIKDWKLIYSELFLLKGKSMENSGGSWHKLNSMHLPVKRTWLFCLALVQDKTFFRKWPFSGWDDRVKTSARAFVFTRCDIKSERLISRIWWYFDCSFKLDGSLIKFAKK
jgi:hypothetical protein